ncbi:MAG: glutamate racemase, partial [Mesorhizobium sp.]
SGAASGENEADIAVFTSGKADFAIRRLIQGFGLTAA